MRISLRPAPIPLYVSGARTVYAASPSGGLTGSDTSLPMGGFVTTPGSHSSWTTSNADMVIQQAPCTFTATVKGDACAGQIAPGSSCSVTVTYNPMSLQSPNGSGYAYDTVMISPITNAGQANDFVQGCTIVLNPDIDSGA